MSEPELELQKEDAMTKAGYYDWLSENEGDLKAEFLTQYSTKELIDHFYWEEGSVQEFFDYHQDSFEEYCESSFETSCDIAGIK